MGLGGMGESLSTYGGPGYEGASRSTHTGSGGEGFAKYRGSVK